MKLETTTKLTTSYNWTLYNQAIAKAKAQYRKDGNYVEFQVACKKAYDRMMQSPDTEEVTIQKLVSK